MRNAERRMQNDGDKVFMERTERIIKSLAAAYPNAHCELNYDTPFKLLVAVILSAQCTDKRVNSVTQKLFQTISTPQQFAEVEQSELEKLIFSCGFYRNKAANIISASRDIITRFNGQVPGNHEDLTSLKGVGRKTANVVLSEAFDLPAIAVDTHVFRVSRRLDFSKGKTPDAVEKDLIKLFSGNNYIKLKEIHHLLIFHGRYCCHSRKPDCLNCTAKEFCESGDKLII